MHVQDRTARHEAGLAYFIEPSFRTRFRGMLAGKGRSKLRQQLWRFRHLDTRFAEPLGSRDPHATLTARGAPATCYVVSTANELDGRKVALSDALGAIHPGWHAAFVSCIPGRLAYFEGELPDHHYILERTDAQ